MARPRVPTTARSEVQERVISQIAHEPGQQHVHAALFHAAGDAAPQAARHPAAREQDEDGHEQLHAIGGQPGYDLILVLHDVDGGHRFPPMKMLRLQGARSLRRATIHQTHLRGPAPTASASLRAFFSVTLRLTAPTLFIIKNHS